METTASSDDRPCLSAEKPRRLLEHDDKQSWLWGSSLLDGKPLLPFSSSSNILSTAAVGMQLAILLAFGCGVLILLHDLYCLCGRLLRVIEVALNGAAFAYLVRVFADVWIHLTTLGVWTRLRSLLCSGLGSHWLPPQWCVTTVASSCGGPAACAVDWARNAVIGLQLR
mgnify:CR=1 FL=1